MPHDTSYRTLLERRVHAINHRTSGLVLEVHELAQGPMLRLVLDQRPISSPTLKWPELYWWLDGWLTALEVLPAPKRGDRRNTARPNT